ncbi:Polyubiquitin (Fragment) [Seminavis robusta]|uniref:Polyubiquitin n=1 Tax=Seminavis robusta TaxID=568900 RepID=A0A9N8HSQ8_9STRA
MAGMTSRRRKQETTRLTKVDFMKREIFVEYNIVDTANPNEPPKPYQFQLFVDPDIEIREACLQPIADHLEIPVDEIHIFYRGFEKEFDDSKSLRFYGLQGGGFFHMTRVITTTKREERKRPSYSEMAQRAIERYTATSTAAASSPSSSSSASEPQPRAASDKEHAQRDSQSRKKPDAHKKAEVEPQQKAAEKETDRKQKAETDRKQKADEEARQKAQAAEEARKKAEAERKQKAAEETRKRAAAERERQAAEERARRAAEEAEQQRKEEEERAAADEARKRADAERQQKAAEDARKKKAEAERKEAEDQERARRAADEAEARRRAEAERKRKLAEEERARRAAEDARKKAEAERQRKAEDEARKKAAEEERARRAAEEAEARRRAEAERQRKADQERARKAAEEDARKKEEAERKRKSEEEAHKKAEAERQRKAEEEARKNAEAERKRKAAEEASKQADAERQRKAAEDEARKKADAERQRKAEDEARKKAEAERQRKAEEEARKRAEAERQRKAAEDARKKAEAERNRKFPITVNAKGGRKIQLLVRPSDSMEALQNQIRQETGVPANKQNLSMGGNQLPTDKPRKAMEECGIKEGSVIDMGSSAINITVKTPNGQRINLQVDPSDDAKSIQQKVEKETGLKVSDQILKYRGKEMAGTTTVDNMGIKNGDVLDVTLREVSVTVRTMDGKTMEIKVDLNKPVSEIKTQLAKLSGIPVKNQKLSIGDKELFNPWKTAADCGITDGSVLDLAPKSVNFYVNTPAGKRVFVQADATDTVADIKAKVEKETGLDSSKQELKFEGKPLANDSTVGEMGIQDGAVLDLEPRTINVNVNAPGGKKIKLKVDPADSMADIKAKLEKATGLKASKQELKFQGSVAPNEKTVEGMGIRDGSVLDLSARSINIDVKTPDGKTVPVQVELSDSGASIKEKIEQKTGLKASDQTLNCRGQEMKNHTSVQDMGLSDGSELTVTVNSPTSRKPPTSASKPAKKKDDKEVENPVTTSDVFVAFTVPDLQSEPSKKEYSALASTTKKFYASSLREKYGSVFDDVSVKVSVPRFGSASPRKNYNVYIEWEINAQFHEGRGQIPNRNELCRSLVQIDLSKYLLEHVRSLSDTAFAGASGMFTEQVNSVVKS